MNHGAIDGIVGGWQRKGKALFVRICHVENFFDNKEQAWKEDSSWITVNFFNKKADVLENQLEKGLRLVVEYSLITFPKEGLNVRLRVNGKSFHILEKKAQMQDRMAGRNQGLSEEEVEYEDKEEAPF